jgi:hypothetical protein
VLEVWSRTRLWPSLALFAAPLYLLVLFPLTPIALAVAAWLLGPRVWPSQTSTRSLAIGAVAAVALIGAVIIVFLFGFGLCAPDSTVTLALAVIMSVTTYTVGSFGAVKYPWIWPLSLVTAAVAFVTVVQIALWRGVEVIC